jgi:hypothetical protein
MILRRLASAINVAAVCCGIVPEAGAQSLGTFKWQLQPYCNVIALTVTQNGPVYRLDGTDDQCGASQRGAAIGSAFTNPDGTIGLGFVLVMAPGGQSVAVEAVITLATLSGTWRDQLGHAGTFAPTSGTSTGGAALPPSAGTPITGVAVGPGLAASLAGGRLDLDVTFGGDGTVPIASRADHSHSVRDASNTGVGLGALDTVRTTPSISTSNTAVGSATLRATTTGAENTAAGVLALGDNTEGWRNVAVGASAMGRHLIGSGNTAVGVSALGFGTLGGSNVAVGHSALWGTTNGVGNVAIGVGSLMRNDTGHNNVAIGTNAGLGASPSESDGIYIGSAGEAGDIRSVRIGSSNHVAAYIAGIAGRTVDGGVPVLTASNGRLGTLVSSARFKQDIRPLTDQHARLGALRPVQFIYAPETGGDGLEVQYGLLAEEVSEAMPELVARDAQGTPWGVRYQLLPPLLLGEVQRLERERSAMAERMRAIRARIDLLEGARPAAHTGGRQ